MTFIGFSLAFCTMFGIAETEVSAHNHGKPVVAIIRADWCRACQRLDPTINELRREYGDRLNFVVLDVTNEETTAVAEARARRLGLSEFFEANKKKTSTVAVFKRGRQVFSAHYNYDRQAYVDAFERALK